MKKFTFLKFVIPLLFLGIQQSHSQNSPIGCNGQFFVSYGSSGDANSTTSVRKLSFSGSTITPNVFATDPLAIGYNGIGLNPIDGYMYGLRYPANNDRVRLVRIGAGTPGNVVDLGEVSNAGGNLSDEEFIYAGCFDAGGVFYFISTDNQLFKITGNNYPASSLTVTYVGSSPGGGTGTNFFVDIAINPVTGIMYGVTYNQRLLSINTTTGATTFINTHSGSEYIAALFFDEVGNLYGYRQDGAFFLINKTTAGLTPAGTGSSYTYADGCSCSFGRVFHTLSSQFPAVCPSQVTPNPTWNITVNVTNQSSIQQTGLTYTLEIPSNRFSFNETEAAIRAKLITAGLLTDVLASTVTISTVTPPTGASNNKLVVANFRTGAPGSTIPFTLQLRVSTPAGGEDEIPLQSVISGLPVLLGGSDLSDDPNTGAPDDPTIVGICSQASLPVTLISFTGSINDNTTSLKWVAENQVNFAYYDIERSSNGTEFSSIGTKAIQGNSTSRESYQYSDNLAAANGNIFFYRLKMVDIDGAFKYSNVIMVRKDQQAINGLSFSPNPMVKGEAATVRFNSLSSRSVEFKIVDISGRIVLTQKNNVSEGTNSVSINKLDRLMPGMYLLQMNDGTTIQTTKFNIVR